jgi:hypothetical protein
MSGYVLHANAWDEVKPESAGWRHLSFSLRTGPFNAASGRDEVALVPLSDRWGVTADGESRELGCIRDRADALEAWQRGIFCELGTGDVDLDGFFRELAAVGYDGWICVEGRIPRENEPLSESAEAQVRNGRWLREHLAR